LSGHDGSIQFNNNGTNANTVPTQQAVNAYTENAGIYD
jgi:hypothetical protein